MEMESSTGSIFLCLLVKEPKKECSLQDFSEILEPYGTNLEPTALRYKIGVKLVGRFSE